MSGHEHHHHEGHSNSGETVRDVIIGMADGLTVPFALAAGLTGAVSAAGIVVTAGLAEIAAGSIAMGLGGYLAARGEAEHYESELKREYWEIEHKPEAEKQEVREVLLDFGLTENQTEEIVETLAKNPEAWVKFMMQFELGLDEPDPKRALTSALTIGGSYIVGGFIPLLPYFMVAHAVDGLKWSIGLTFLALIIFGAVKGHFTGSSPLKSAIQTTAIGGLAAAAAFGLARVVSG